jgi:hypothetical protein
MRGRLQMLTSIESCAVPWKVDSLSHYPYNWPVEAGGWIPLAGLRMTEPGGSY